LVALGIGTTVTAGTAAAAAATGVAAKGTTAALVKTGTGVVVAKWVGIATVGGLGTWGVVEQVREPEQVSQPVAAVAVPAATRAAQVASTRIAVTAAPSADEAASDETSPADPEPTASTQPVAPGPYGAVQPSATQSEPSLAAEVKALDRAREAMESDDPATALKQLEAYQRKYSAGTLGQEAAVLRIEALAKAGKTARARAAAAAFLAQYPASPYAQRVRSVVAKSPASTATSSKQSTNPTKTGAKSGTGP